MARQIGLSVKIGSDTRGLQEGTRLSRNELRTLRTTLRQAEPAASKLAERQKVLERAFRQGKITNAQYENGLRHINERFGDDSGTGLIGKLGVAAVAIGTLALGWQALRGAASATLDAMERIDPTIKTARAIGVSFGELRKLQLALGESSGLAGSEVEAALAKLGARTAEAARGTGEAQKAFDLLGLNARELAELNPAQQFREIGIAMQGVADQNDRLLIAQKLFEEQGRKFVNGLMAQGDAFDQLGEAYENLGVILSKDQTENIEAANDAINRMTLAVEGLKLQIGSGLAPEIEKVATGWQMAIDSMGGVENILNTYTPSNFVRYSDLYLNTFGGNPDYMSGNPEWWEGKRLARRRDRGGELQQMANRLTGITDKFGTVIDQAETYTFTEDELHEKRVRIRRRERMEAERAEREAARSTESQSAKVGASIGKTIAQSVSSSQTSRMDDLAPVIRQGSAEAFRFISELKAARETSGDAEERTADNTEQLVDSFGVMQNFFANALAVKAIG